ncbi:hypothetical protein GLYMA_17G220200v4 [Glycine max]|uniref:Uncharacterized protein n=1 Tax=Glycine max TaxID=3847 RepID=A0A0R0FQD2_SOYBN|nr:hypothetical protein GYH30_048094 [Glycine max]KRH05321.1 hypothetical protein GLYMA_17G220200v4 [Glycine max]
MEMASSSFILGSDFKCMFSSRNTKTMSGFGALRHPHPNGLFSKCFHFHTLSTRTVSGTTKMVSDVYVGGVTSFRVNSKMYTKLDSCLVIPPTPNRAKPRAIVKFLGGAFIGAVPEVTYGAALQLGPAVSQMMPVVEATPFYSIARNASGDVWKMMLDAVRSTLQETEQEILNSLTKFVDQLPSVMNEVTQGVSEFKPTPSENRDCFKCLYNVEHTLLVKFNSDAIDETDILEETLKLRVESLGGTLEKVTLSGNHITPCIQEPRWQVGKLYTPADAVAQGLKSLSLNDTKILARTISDWFRRFEG